VSACRWTRFVVRPRTSRRSSPVFVVQLTNRRFISIVDAWTSELRVRRRTCAVSKGHYRFLAPLIRQSTQLYGAINITNIRPRMRSPVWKETDGDDVQSSGSYLVTVESGCGSGLCWNDERVREWHVGMVTKASARCSLGKHKSTSLFPLENVAAWTGIRIKKNIDSSVDMRLLLLLRCCMGSYLNWFDAVRCVLHSLCFSRRRSPIRLSDIEPLNGGLGNFPSSGGYLYTVFHIIFLMTFCILAKQFHCSLLLYIRHLIDVTIFLLHIICDSHHHINIF